VAGVPGYGVGGEAARWQVECSCSGLFGQQAGHGALIPAEHQPLVGLHRGTVGDELTERPGGPGRTTPSPSTRPDRPRTWRPRPEPTARQPGTRTAISSSARMSLASSKKMLALTGKRQT